MNRPYEKIDLFSRLKDNDLSAFNEIYNIYSKKILNFAYSFSISLEDAEEIVQDTFVKLWKKREYLDLSKSAEALIFVIAKNLVLNKIKEYSVDRERLKSYFNSLEERLDSSLEEKLNFKEIESILNEIIEELPEKRKEIFKLNRFKGLTYKEIAKFLDVSPGTVEKQMKKALETINEKFGAYVKLFFLLSFLDIIQSAI